jgi:hypothetical protein
MSSHVVQYKYDVSKGKGLAARYDLDTDFNIHVTPTKASLHYWENPEYWQQLLRNSLGTHAVL